MEKVFITGIEGFVGEHLLQELLSHNYKVVGLYYTDLSAVHLEKYGIPLYAGDITDRKDIWEILDKVEPNTIIHLAAITSIPQSIQFPMNTWKVNLWGTLNIMEWIRQRKPQTKLLAISSGEVYGIPDSEDELPFTEKNSLKPVNIYASTKAAAEMAARQYRNIWKLPIVIARPFNHIGPGQSNKFVASAFAKQIAEIMEKKIEPIVRVGNLLAHRDFLDVRDVVRAYRMLISDESIFYQKNDNLPVGNRIVFNICSGNPIEIQTILDMLIDISDIEVEIEIDSNKFRPIDIPIIYGSHEKITKRTGWRPDIPLRKTLNDTLQYWLEKM